MGHFNSAKLIGKRQFRTLTGVRPDVFRKMVTHLQAGWRRIARAKNRSGRPYGVGGLNDHLLVLLMIYRCHITQDFLALLYNVDKATICRALRRIEALARRVLGVKRKVTVTAAQAQALLIDATEQPVERPGRHQQRWYSGKKKRHTIKNEIVITETGRIAATSPSAPGAVHDLTIRRRGPPLPKGARAYADSGYQGYDKDHPDLDIPYKKPRGGKLTSEEKHYNHALSRFRVRVEHVIARMKKFRILADRFRYPRSTHSAKFATIAGIVNLVAGG